MPIKPENKARYPANWKEIRAAVLERAGNACEGSPAYPKCRVENGTWRINSTGICAMDEDLAYAMCDVGEEPTRIVLTIGHLDHTPENCDMANLRAWCQRCHLTYDAKHHAQTAHATRRQGKALTDLFKDSPQ